MVVQKDSGKTTLSIEKAVSEIAKRFGDGTVMRLGEAAHMQVEAIPTGSLSLDIALGVGGVPRGRVIITRPQIIGQNYSLPTHHRRSTKRGGVWFYRYGTCARPCLRR